MPAMRCEDIDGHPDFRALDDIAGLQVELRYATESNFVGRNLYGSLNCHWVHRQVAQGLERAVAWLAFHAPGVQLKVLDALRPHRVQVLLWDHLDGTDLRQYVADPALGSIHSFGMAIDLTLVDAQGRELDMGAGFDEMSELSHPVREAQHLAAGRLTAVHVAHRELLRGAMRAGGFKGVDNEWWHFDMGDRAHIRATFVRVD
jgi:zinc D-Ala-D-Ala dipeptidase